jgi:hypothetical protein
MHRDEELRAIVKNLIEVLREKAVELEKLTDHLAQRVGRRCQGRGRAGIA